MGFAPHSLSPAELTAVLEAERHGAPFVAYRDGGGSLRLVALEGLSRAAIGRLEENDIALAWDTQASRTHAQLERVGAEWTVVDDGLSRNGTFVNGERLAGRAKLTDGDTVRIGGTAIVFRAPRIASGTTVAADPVSVRVTDAERRVLVSLCRPLAAPDGTGFPASNQRIADELHLSLAGVKTHMRALSAKLAVDELPRYEKRTVLARRALDLGLVTPRDF